MQKSKQAQKYMTKDQNEDNLGRIPFNPFNMIQTKLRQLLQKQTPKSKTFAGSKTRKKAYMLQERILTKTNSDKNANK